MKKIIVRLYRFLLIIVLTCLSIGISAQSNEALNIQLFNAIKSADFEKVKELIAKGADVNAADSNKATVLMWAAYKGDLATVKYIVNKGADYKKKGIIYLNDEKTSTYGSPLIIAAGEGKLDLVKYFVEECNTTVDDKEYGDINGNSGWTALTTAAYQGNYEVAEYLISKGANVNEMYFMDNGTPLLYAMQTGHYSIARLLILNNAETKIKYYDGFSPLHYASRDGETEIVKLLLAKNIDINDTVQGWTPLMIAAYNDHAEICRLFYVNGANLNFRNKEGKTAADIGKERNNIEVINFFNNPSSYVSDNNISDDISRAFDYFNNKDYAKAVEIFEKYLPAIKEQYGENDTSTYFNIVSYLTYCYTILKNNDKEEIFLLERLRIIKTVLGEKHPDYALSLSNLASLYKEMGNYPAAEPLYIESKNIFKEVFGEKHPFYATSLNNLALLYYAMGKYPAAEPLYLEAKNIYKEVLGEKHPSYATSLNNLALLYEAMGNYPAAEPLYLEAKNILKEVLGEKHPDYASSLDNLAALYDDIGNYSAAESLYIEAKNIRKEVLGVKHPSYATSLNNLAGLYEDMGNYPAAEPLLLEAKNIRKEVLGEKHPTYAGSLISLGALYYWMGNYSAAEPLYIEAKNIDKEVLGEKHPSYATDLNNLASLYQKMGNYPAAEPLYIEAKNICKEVLGEKHPDYALSLNNLALLYYAMGNSASSEKDRADKYAAAEPLYIEAKNIRKEALGEKHPVYATSLNNLALLYYAIGDYLAAEPLYIEAKNIRKEVLGEKHPLYAQSLNNLAALYYAMGYSASSEKDRADKYAAAESLYLEAKNIWKEVLGEKHPDYASSLNNLAGLYQAMGNYPVAEPLYLEGLKIINSAIVQNFTFLSEKEKEQYFNTQKYIFNSFYSFALKRKENNPAIVSNVYDNAIKNKGLLLKSSTAMRTAIINSNNTLLISQYEKWIALEKEISKLYSTEISKRNKNPEELEQQANALEKDLVRGSQAFSDFEKVQNLSCWESVKQNLKPSEAAIEFTRFRVNEDSVLYCALLVKPDSKYPEMIKLFEEKDLSDLLGNFGGNNSSYINSIYGTNQDANDKLYKLIWVPLGKYLEGIKTIYYSPDGLLHKVSFAALSKGKNLYLCDAYNLKQQSSTGKVAMPESFTLDVELTAGLFGGIEYSADTTRVKLWNYLPGTKSETDNIDQVFKNEKLKTIYYTGASASEENFKSIAGNCNILHLSTHGFFFPDPEEIKKEEKEKNVSDVNLVFRGTEYTGVNFGLWNFVRNKSPLMRSGLALAGANRVWNNAIPLGEDGVLTAMEVTQLDLRKTQLVVMSACETGLGDIKGSEGVYGLQRAFKMAGVKFIIMSLWQVPDKETAEFMTTFYKKLLKDKDIRKTFGETQAEMRQKYDPYYWGAFVLIE